MVIQDSNYIFGVIVKHHYIFNLLGKNNVPLVILLSEFPSIIKSSHVGSY